MFWPNLRSSSFLRLKLVFRKLSPRKYLQEYNIYILNTPFCLYHSYNFTTRLIFAIPDWISVFSHFLIYEVQLVWIWKARMHSIELFPKLLRMQINLKSYFVVASHKLSYFWAQICACKYGVKFAVQGVEDAKLVSWGRNIARQNGSCTHNSHTPTGSHKSMTYVTF